MKQEKVLNNQRGQTVMEFLLLFFMIFGVGYLIMQQIGPLVAEKVVEPLHQVMGDTVRFGVHRDGGEVSEDPTTDNFNPYHGDRSEAIHLQ